jgi:hypothetical protein
VASRRRALFLVFVRPERRETSAQGQTVKQETNLDTERPGKGRPENPGKLLQYFPGSAEDIDVRNSVRAMTNLEDGVPFRRGLHRLAVQPSSVGGERRDIVTLDFGRTREQDVLTLTKPRFWCNTTLRNGLAQARTEIPNQPGVHHEESPGKFNHVNSDPIQSLVARGRSWARSRAGVRGELR